MGMGMLSEANELVYIYTCKPKPMHMHTACSRNITMKQKMNYIFYYSRGMLILGFLFLSAENHTNLSPYLSYVSGALAGCAATVGSYPFDLLRTILASQGEPKVYALIN